MSIVSVAKSALNPKARRFIHLGAQMLTDPLRARYKCPICTYRGPFQDANFHADVYGASQTDAICPSCGSYERHRMQRLIFEELSRSIDFSRKSLLHVAPEVCNMEFFRKTFGRYTTADLNTDCYAGASGQHINSIDLQLDLTKMDLADASYDVVLATHVLEHIEDDRAAMSEIRRILKPDGFAVIPVPIVAAKTIEYPCGNGREFGHVRACGPDYFDRHRPSFSAMRVYKSSEFPAEHQLYFVQDRTKWPTESCPMLIPLHGKQHMDYTPVYWA